ncbi:MAG: hypothetical protein KBH25_07535 [Aeromonadaceae bacterium]|nr:hypothetical protein [Aeromonadaceae bacterium]
MSHINWLEVEGVRYEGQGDSILCQTAVGFRSQLPGMMLEDLEVSDAHGNPLGYLSVDFASGHLAISPVVSSSELAATQIVIDDETGVRHLSLDALPLTNSLLASLAESDADYMDPSVLTPSTGVQGDYFLALTSVVSDADETLDSFFGESRDPVEDSPPVATNQDVSLAYASLYLEHGSEPSQMPLLPETPDLTHLF